MGDKERGYEWTRCFVAVNGRVRSAAASPIKPRCELSVSTAQDSGKGLSNAAMDCAVLSFTR
jgi:hypothetical protein